MSRPSDPALALLAAVLLVAAVSLTAAAPTGSCGAGLAAQDLAGTCRVPDPKMGGMTMGALQAVGAPALPKPRIIKIEPMSKP